MTAWLDPRPSVVAGNALPPPATKLRVLMTLRAVAVTGQVAAIVASLLLGVDLPAGALAVVLAMLVAVQAVAWRRLRRPAPLAERDVAVCLALDLAAFSALLFLSGGAANPFSLFFVLHAALFGLLLPPMWGLAGLAAVIFLFSLLTHARLPLELVGGTPLPSSLAAFGTWVSVVLTASVVAWFVMRNTSLLREHHELLVGAARKMRNDEAIQRLGSLAAGAAHELASPLTTMGAIAENIEREATTSALRAEAAILSAQVAACRRTLSTLLSAAGHPRAEGGGAQALDDFLAATIARFRALRPDVVVDVAWPDRVPAPLIYADRALQQALLVLLDNAGDASAAWVRFTARWDDESLQVTVEDRGPGIDPACGATLGRVIFSTKPPGSGSGLGLVLATDTVHAFDGTLSWHARAEGGTCAQVRLPLRGLRTT